MPDTIVTVHLIRHAETDSNRSNDRIGIVDATLTDEGHKQISALSEYALRHQFRPQRFYTSDMSRAIATAEGLLPAFSIANENLIRDPRLREISQGEWEGKLRADIHNDAGRARMERYDMDHRAPGGESMHDVSARMRFWLYDAVDQAIRDNIGTIAAVSHGVAIKCIVQRVLGADAKHVWRMQIDNTSITTIRCSQTQWSLVRLNATPHLPFRS